MTNAQFTTVTDIQPLAQARGWDYRTLAPPTLQQHDISRTTGEEIIDALQRTDQDVDAYVAFHKERRESRIHQNTRLHAVYEYEVPESFTCLIPDVQIVEPDGLAVTDDGELLTQALTHKTAVQARLMFTRARHFPSRRTSAGTHVSLLCSGAQNYFHWMMDALMRLSLLDPADTSYKVIIPADAPPFIGETLDLFGIGPERRVHYGLEKLSIEALLLVYAHYTPAKPKTEHLLAHREHLFAVAGVDPSSMAPRRRLYISRAGAYRAVVNEDELLPILREHGFEVVHCEQLTVREQIALFAEANVIVGPHGAGITNFLFARPGATIVEMFNRMLWVDCYQKVGSLLGHEHWHMFAENEDTTTWPTRVDARRFEKLLTTALGSTVSQ